MSVKQLIPQDYELGNISKDTEQNPQDLAAEETQVYEQPVLAQPPSSRAVSVVSAPEEVSPAELQAQRKTELRCFATLLLIIFVEGWNDGTPGGCRCWSGS